VIGFVGSFGIFPVPKLSFGDASDWTVKWRIPAAAMNNFVAALI
jgi:hypothetical protein